jgi:hypothetical protein
MTRKGRTEPFRATEVDGAERDQVIAAFHAQAPGPMRRIFNRLPDAADHPAFRLEPAPDPALTARP